MHEIRATDENVVICNVIDANIHEFCHFSHTRMHTPAQTLYNLHKQIKTDKFDGRVKST